MAANMKDLLHGTSHGEVTTSETPINTSSLRKEVLMIYEIA
jgi:hypothetical protein